MAANAIVREASLAEVMAFFGGDQRHLAAEIDGEMLAVATLKRVHGRLWAWFDAQENLDGRRRIAVFYALRKGLRQIGEPVFVTCNKGVHRHALDLLRYVGFRPTGESVNGDEVWKWQS